MKDKAVLSVLFLIALYGVVIQLWAIVVTLLNLAHVLLGG